MLGKIKKYLMKQARLAHYRLHTLKSIFIRNGRDDFFLTEIFNIITILILCHF